MRSRLRTLLCIALLLAVRGVAVASNDPDSRSLTPAERAMFLPLVCRSAIDDPKDGARCTALIGYPQGPQNVTDLSLISVVYGKFTNANADQAYVSYGTMSESHANNFGGGILFVRSHATWRVVRWYPGSQMDRCVAIPVTGTTSMLCLTGYLQNGELTTTVVTETLADASAQDRPSTKVLIGADDTRDMSSGASGAGTCGALATYTKLVVSIDSLQRTTAPGFFAESRVTYVTPAQWYQGCKKNDAAGIKGQTATVRYALKDGRVTFDSPVTIAPPKS